VNKDNLLFATIGLLFGFIAGYLLHEVVVARQPLRRPVGETGVVTAPPDAPTPGAAADMPGGPEARDAAPADAAGQPAQAGQAPQTPDAPAGAAAAAQASAGPGAGTAAAPGGQAQAAQGGGGAAAAGGGGRGAAGAPGMAAIQQLRDHVAAHPNDAEAVLKLANLNFDIQSWARARDLYSQYLGLRPPSSDVLTDLGNCYRELRQFDAALQQFRRAEQLTPGHWKSLFSEVVVLAFDLKQLDAADKAMARLQAQAPPGQPEVAQLAAALKRQRSSG
jgi:tetratricopeptide (TPR) repeat protein